MIEFSEIDERKNNLNPANINELNVNKEPNIRKQDDDQSIVKANIPSGDDSLIQPSTSESFNSLPRTEDSDIADPSDEDNVGVTSNLMPSPVELTPDKNVIVQAMNITMEEGTMQCEHPIAEQSKPAVLPEKRVDPRIPPKLNCPEKIVFCIDLSSEMNEPPFKLGSGSQFSPLAMVKRVIEIFVHSKLKMDSTHQFAVLGFHDVAIWFHGFSSDPKEVFSALDSINEVKTCHRSALSSVFTLLNTITSELPAFNKPNILLPRYVVRVILIYGRSNCIPEKLEQINTLKTLKTSPCFFMDVLYIHETPSSENRCQEIFERLCDFDENDTSYIFEVGRNTTKLHNCMAKLLAHPLQRPLQKYTHYKLQRMEIQC